MAAWVDDPGTRNGILHLLWNRERRQRGERVSQLLHERSHLARILIDVEGQNRQILTVLFLFIELLKVLVLQPAPFTPGGPPGVNGGGWGARSGEETAEI